MVRLLLEHGAGVDIASKTNATPLLIASQVCPHVPQWVAVQQKVVCWLTHVGCAAVVWTPFAICGCIGVAL